MKLPPVASFLLLPLSWLFRGALILRDLGYAIGSPRPSFDDVIVISVGNITVGGTGKTPMVMYLAQRLSDRGKRVGILSRGYRGRAATDSARFPGARDSSVIHSDETSMMKRDLPKGALLGVGANRWEHAVALRREGIEWFILDDGFQHRQMHRDVDIVLVDSLNPIGNGRLLPAGPLREPLTALSRADVIVITRDGDHASVETMVRSHSKAPVFHASTELKEIVPAAESLAVEDASAWLGRNMFVFCAIGNSEAFVQDVQRWGMSVKGHRSFPDHHRYTHRDIDELERLARDAGADALMCTAKDTYNLQKTKFRNLPLYVCRITMRIQEEKQFWDAIYGTIEKKEATKPR